MNSTKPCQYASCHICKHVNDQLWLCCEVLSSYQRVSDTKYFSLFWWNRSMGHDGPANADVYMHNELQIRMTHKALEVVLDKYYWLTAIPLDFHIHPGFLLEWISAWMGMVCRTMQLELCEAKGILDLSLQGVEKLAITTNIHNNNYRVMQLLLNHHW